MARWFLRRLTALGCAIAVPGTLACGSSSRDESRSAEPERPRSSAPAVSDRARLSPNPRIVVLGDSLTAGLGIAPSEAYPALLQERIDGEGLKYEVVNAGVSGDTSAGGLRRLDWALDGQVKVLIVALGGNDGLRGLPVEELGHNLAAIIERARSRGIDVILAGMEAPTNFGSSYTTAFHQVYPDLARRYQVALVPFLLEGVAGIESLNQRDGIHPTPEGAKRIADNVWTVLRPMLR